jgi:hypothetical protein
MLSPQVRGRAWLLCLILAIAWVWWSTTVRHHHIDRVTAVGREAIPETVASGLRHLIVPERLPPTYDWITQTQQMLESGQLRVRHTDTDNAPHGRPVHAASAYRWWLGAFAWLRQIVHGDDQGATVEWAIRWADPILHVVFMIAVTLFAARYFGRGAAAVVPLAAALLFPLGAGFLPATPDDFGLFLALSPGFVLPLVAVFLHPEKSASWQHRLFALAGVAGGAGLWIDVNLQVPVLCGIATGAIAAAALVRRHSRSGTTAKPPAELALPSPWLWRTWGAAGAATAFLAYLIEYFPSHLGEWEFRAIHPLYSLAWLGGAEFLAQTCAVFQRVPASPQRRALLLAAGVLGFASLPFAMWYSGNLGFLNSDLLAFRLTKLPEGMPAAHLVQWLEEANLTAPLVATLLPATLLVVIGTMILRTTANHHDRYALAIAAGPLLIALGFACVHLRWWQLFDALLIAAVATLLVALARTKHSRWIRLATAAIMASALALGASQLKPPRVPAGAPVLSVAETEGLVERDLAHSLAKRLGDGRQAIVLAPPGVSSALNFYAGMRGLASLSWENKDGLAVALRIVVSSSREEAHALVRSRGVTHIVIPSWDPFYETYARTGSVRTNELFLASLRRGVVPPWLRPVVYRIPVIRGFENESVAIFEVVDEQEPPIAMSRLVEYFVEMGQMEAAKVAGEALRRYPADFSALVARAQLEAALTDATAFSAALDTIVQRLSARADRTLPWDRRVSLAIVLARGKRLDLAKTHIERCLQTIDEQRLRALPPTALLHFQILLKAVELQISDPALRTLAVELLAPEVRSRV